MSANDLWRLQSQPTGDPTGTGTRGQRRPFFSRFELSLLVILTVSSASLVIFSLVYLLQHRDSVKPAAIIAICLAGLLLAGMLVVVSRRMRSTDRQTDLEDGLLKNWRFHAPIKPIRWSKQPQFDTKGLYSVIPDHRQQTTDGTSFVDRIRTVIRKTLSPSSLSGSSFGTFPSPRCPFREGSSDSRPSMETTEGLWASVFELPANDTVEQLRRDNLKRLSKDSRRSRYEMSASDERPPINKGVEVLDVVTRPRSTLSPPRSRRELGIKLREPHDSHPSSRSRSRLQVPDSIDEVGRGRVRTDIGHGNPELGRARMLPVVSPGPHPSSRQTRPSNNTHMSRGLRKLPSPQAPGCEDLDLRTAFNMGQEGGMEKS